MSDFNADALRPLLILRNGDIRAIADDMAVDSEDLRNFVLNNPALRRAMDEVLARAVDHSVSVLFKGLDDEEHFGNQLAAAKEFIKSRAGKKRGFHHSNDLELKLPRAGGALTLTWLPPEDNRKPEPPLIEGEVAKE
jgi:hypothetical protein